MPEPDEQELGPQIADAFQSKAHTVQGLRSTGYAAEARRRVHRRRQRLTMAAAAVVVVAAIGGVWGVIGGPSPVTTSSTAGSAADNGSKMAPEAPAEATVVCPEQHAILAAPTHEALPSGDGLDLDHAVVFGLEACRYRLEGAQMLLGSAHFNAATAQQVVDAIKVLPERNPSLPVFKCTPQTARPKEAIVLRFDTATGIREVWVGYDGCSSAGFFTGTRTYGLYAAPLKLFMTGTVRPAGGIYLDHLKGW
ncbi:hypothetical protein GCM10009554_56320 [Kribbella koreensis]|uniref:DUF3558 domain-containing protein n=1 Tax=Kribbella koreensis TaxID=57909 RepID=A0ABP4BPC0_9ACTN